jgi:hypothetical protein
MTVDELKEDFLAGDLDSHAAILILVEEYHLTHAEADEVVGEWSLKKERQE